eukprot:TRINITY_DN16269_c0_g1_i2.p1 TRINITY_DN16269_c0_g1~~TRINITY_DN16269_c0_g1_i2.p1  ORF type:complete len:100 (-),score=1.39 TRINITY_DN16269_c0_g1_i2:87-386(-)
MSSYVEQSSFGHRHPSGHDATWPSDRVRGVHPTGLSTSDMDGASSCGHYAHPDIKPCGADINSSLNLFQVSGTKQVPWCLRWARQHVSGLNIARRKGRV